MTLSVEPFAIDDGPMVRMDTRGILKDAGYRRREADDGDPVKDLLGERPEKIALMDEAALA